MGEDCGGGGGETTKSWWPAVPVDRNRVAPSSMRAAGQQVDGRSGWWRPVIDGQRSGSGLSRADHPTNREASKVAVQWTRSHQTSLAGCCLSLYIFLSPTPELPRSVPSLGRWNLWAVHFSLSDVLSLHRPPASSLVPVRRPCDQIQGWANLDRPCWLEDFCVSWFVFFFFIVSFFFCFFQ